MSKHGTASQVNGSYVEFQAAVLRALPRDIDPDIQLGWTKNGESLARVLRDVLMPADEKLELNPQPTLSPAIPADGVEFELTLATTPDPLGMVKSDGYDPSGWEFKGNQVVPGTRRFKLVRVGDCQNLDEVRQKLQVHGEIPEGQWREAFRQAFPRNDSKGPIGFADPAWASPRGFTYFPMLHEDGKAWRGSFIWSDYGHDVRWRWLVACK